jgi:Ca2+-binding EF-hand superfamily protein
MMRDSSFRNRVRAILLLAASVGLAGTSAAQYPTSTLHEMLSDKPIIPSKAELPDAAFKKLDAGGKGYVAREDVKGLSGFDKSFQLADANNDGRLNRAEFDKAWANYTGRKEG